MHNVEAKFTPAGAFMAEVQGRRASHRLLTASLWLTLFALAVKIWLGWSSQSFSLITESLHTLIAGMSLLLSLIAISAREASGREIWGHSRLEALLALMLVAFMGFACVSLGVVCGQQVVASLGRLTGTGGVPPIQTTLEARPWLLSTLAAMIALLGVWGLSVRYAALHFTSSALRFNSSCLLSDAGLMLLVAAVWWGTHSGHGWLDPVLAIGLVFTAIAQTYRLLNCQLPLLLRQMAIAPEALAQTIHQVEGITHCYAIRSQGVVGRQVFVEMRLILHPECLSLARTIAERIERLIRDRYGPAKIIIYIDSDLTVKPEPAPKS
jgi:divalent metal cation (Fe/Co/Zn/Cd) transporter